MYHLSPSTQFIHNLFYSHDSWLTETYEIEDHLSYFDPYAWWIPCCFVSRLRVVQQNLWKPWSFWARRTCWCWFLSLGELGFEALTSLVGCPRCLVLTVDISPLVSRRVSAKTWSNMSTMITCIMCYMLYTEKCKPSNKNANCVFRQLKNYYEMKLWKA